MIKIPNYKILKKIGSGGMGDVYLAEHNLIKRKVAIKSLHSNLVKNTDFITRFRKEGETLAGLDHPNIVRLNEYLEHDGGLFLIMEFVEGIQLDNYIKNETGPIPEKELVPLFSQVLDAITYAHKKDIIHRDIKPSNIFVTPDKKVKILDFGIAKLASENKGITKTGVQVGTVTYMSPEQVKGVSVDKLTDIYSLGVTLFQMAVGKVPYDNTNAFNTQMQIVSEPFPKPTEFYPGVSEKLEAIILKATQKDKKDRYQSCEEFKMDLNSKNVVVVEPKQPKQAKQPKQSKKLKVLEKKKRLRVGKYVFALVLFLVIGSFLYYNNNIIEQIKPEPELLGCTDSTATNYNSKANTDDGSCLYAVEEVIACTDDCQKACCLGCQATKGDAVCLADHSCCASHVEEVAATNVNTSKNTKKKKSNNTTINTKSNTSTTNTRSNNSSISAEYYIKLAKDNYDKEKYQLAITNSSSAIRIDPNSHLSYYYRGLAKKQLGNFNDAIVDYTKAIKIKPVNYYYSARGIAKDKSGLSFCNDYKTACDLDYETACKWYNEECNKKSNINKNQAYYLKKGMKFYEDRDYESAIDNYTKAISISSVFSLAYYQRGLAYFKLRRFQEAIDDYTEAIKLFNNEPHNIKNLTLAFRDRASSKEHIIGSDFCADYQKACELGLDKDSCKKYKDCR